MKPIQNVFLLLLIILCNNLLGQSFKKDWKDLKLNKNWTTTLSSDISIYITGLQSPIGRISFVNKIYPEYVVRLVVFDKEVALTPQFKERIHQWLVMQSCASRMLAQKEDVESFFYGNFYYYVEPCDKCYTSTTINGECNKLAKYINTKTKKLTLSRGK